MRTGPNYAPICAAILGVGGVYWFWSKKEADKGRFLLFGYLTTAAAAMYLMYNIKHPTRCLKRIVSRPIVSLKTLEEVDPRFRM